MRDALVPRSDRSARSKRGWRVEVVPFQTLMAVVSDSSNQFFSRQDDCGLAGRFGRGFSAGGRSFGYRTEAVAGGRRMVIDEAEETHVRWIVEQTADGHSPRAIAPAQQARRGQRAWRDLSRKRDRRQQGARPRDAAQRAVHRPRDLEPRTVAEKPGDGKPPLRRASAQCTVKAPGGPTEPAGFAAL